MLIAIPIIHHAQSMIAFASSTRDQHIFLTPRTLVTRATPNSQKVRIQQIKQLSSLLLRRESRLPDIATTQLDAKHALHVPQDLLVRGGGAALEVGDDALGGVALGGEVFLGHLGLHLLAPLGDDGADVLADGRGLDDVVGPVDLGEMLAFDTWAGGLEGEECQDWVISNMDMDR